MDLLVNKEQMEISKATPQSRITSSTFQLGGRLATSSRGLGVFRLHDTIHSIPNQTNCGLTTSCHKYTIGTTTNELTNRGVHLMECGGAPSQHPPPPPHHHHPPPEVLFLTPLLRSRRRRKELHSAPLPRALMSPPPPIGPPRPLCTSSLECDDFIHSPTG